jgi:ribosomal protein S27E
VEEEDADLPVFEDGPGAEVDDMVGKSEIFQVQCPGCAHRFPVIRGQRTLTCPRCGTSGDM